jgi:hypothetical protein
MRPWSNKKLMLILDDFNQQVRLRHISSFLAETLEESGKARNESLTS